jgi:hypothetical protein
MNRRVASIFGVGGLVVLAGLLGSGAASPAGSVAPPTARFVQLPPGWHQYREPPDATALNWHYQPTSNGWAPSMPRGGIAVAVYFPHPRENQRYRPLRLLMPRHPFGFLEGTRDTLEYRIYGRVRGVDVAIFVDIHRTHPTCADLDMAQLIVARIRFS